MDMHETTVTIVMVFVFAVAQGLFFFLACRAIRQGVLPAGYCHLNENVT
jgi:hypothetical protein